MYSNEAHKAFYAGYDCAINGATQENCHYKIFKNEEMKAAWELGNKEGKIVIAKMRKPHDH